MSQAQNEHTFDDFLEVHECQLLASGVPEIFWECLFEKLKNEVGSVPVLHAELGTTQPMFFIDSRRGEHVSSDF